MTECKPIRGAPQKIGDDRHLFQLKKTFPKKVRTKLHYHGAMRFRSVGFYGAGAPTVRHVRTEQDQIARAIIGDAVANQPLAAAVDDQRQLELRVIVPVKGELKIVSLKCDERRRSGGNLLEMGLHAPQCN